MVQLLKPKKSGNKGSKNLGLKRRLPNTTTVNLSCQKLEAEK